MATDYATVADVVERREAFGADEVQELGAGCAVLGDGGRGRGLAESFAHDFAHV